MILAAGLLVLLGLGLFVGGIVTGLVALYWGCVAACGLAAVLLVVARLRTAREAGDPDRRAAESASGAGTTTSVAATDTPPPEAPRTPPQPVVDPEPAAAAPAGATAVRTPEAAPEPAGATALRTPERGPEPEQERSVEEPPTTVPPTTAAANGHADEHIPARRGAHEPRESPADATTGEPGEEDVEVTDLLLVVDLADEVLVVDEHPRYHLPGCPHLEGREDIGLPMVEARADGFTPCGTCRPVRHLAGIERSRRRAARGN
ncbi:hypothetical protein [Geodermatophilus poikilotrophus]|uniref:Uncharacterized protein n=1 Tax=Geodermatophilus poikilotrophus TaxID=1333667 RepID=A0A1I0B8W5_9ACTN|nr:hypothetical protein [Geodermatophilus poikilotrophus]SET02515.1 hypothetical protein SAMN04488546_1137 [Geodermatophilus poikilotrophus]